MPVTPDRLAGLVLSLVLVRVVLNSAEVVAGRSEYRTAGTFGWSIRKASRDWTSRGTVAHLLTLGLEYPKYLWLMLLQLVCALCILVAPQSPLWMLLVVLAIELLSSLRNQDYGADGSDRLHLIVLCAITLYFAFSTTAARMLALWFIALTAMTAYLTAGIVKLLSPAWRNGTAIEFVLLSENYGAPALGRYVLRRSHLNQALCWSTIAFECGFPFVVMLGPMPTLVLLSCGILFHLAIAAVMGLNGFFWSFVATYPAIFRLSVELHNCVR